MRSLALAVTLVMAALLLWAGLEKARAVKSFASVLRQLGVPAATAPVLARIVIALELSAGLGLIYSVSLPTITAVTGLATAFACAGLIALRRPQRIVCSCFGPYGTRALGRDQLIALPLWLGGVAILWSQRLMPPMTSRASLLAVVALGMASMRVAAAVHAAYVAHGDRRSAREMYLWLNR